MLTYDMNKRGKTPGYKYLYHCIKDDILNGNLIADEKLPSKRTLAEHLGVSVVTVMSAYELLTSEGYVYTQPKKGYYVIPIKAQKKAVSFVIEPPDKDESKIDFDFSLGTANNGKFPFSIWSRLMRRTILDYENELLNPLPYNGTEILRNAVCRYLYHHSGMNVSPEQIIIGAGTEYLYNLIIQLLGKDKIFAVENPGYTKIPQIYCMNGVKTEYIDVDNKGLTCSGLYRCGADVVHISPGHHFPTGVIMPVDRRHELLNWADETGGYIIEDDYDSEFSEGTPAENLFTTDKNERVIYLNTFSKTIAPSIRISYLVLPRHLLQIYRERMNFLSCTVSGFEQYTLAAFINEGYFERHINRMRRYYSGLEREVIDYLKTSEIKDKIKIIENNSGLHFLMILETEKSDDELLLIMKNNSLNARFLSHYLHNDNPDMEHRMIVNYSGFNMDKLKKAVQVLEKII